MHFKDEDEEEVVSTGRLFVKTILVLIIIALIVSLACFSYPVGFTKTAKKQKPTLSSPQDEELFPSTKKREEESDVDVNAEKDESYPKLREHYIRQNSVLHRVSVVITSLPRNLFPALEVSLMLDELLEQERANDEYIEMLHVFGLRYFNLEHYRQSVVLFESHLELKLGINDWIKLVESIINQSENEWVFLYDVGDNVTDYISHVLKCYLLTQEYTKADYMYRLIIGLLGSLNGPEYTIAYATFAVGIGDIWTAIQQFQKNSISLFLSSGLGNDHDAHNVITSHALRLFSAGFSMYAATLTRSLILGRHKVWAVLKENCKLEDNPFTQSSVYTKIHFREVVDLLSICTLRFNVIERLIEDGAVLYASNVFGWVPVLQAAFVGSNLIVEEMLRKGADPLVHTQLGHTSLHIAAMHGRYDMVPNLLHAGLSAQEVDYFNRTAMDIACLHGKWNAETLAAILNAQIPPNCFRKPPFHKGGKVGAGGWLPSYTALPGELTEERCDFDSVVDLDVDSFLYNYLLLQRPVLVRNALNTTLFQGFLKRWERSNFQESFGYIHLPFASIPLAQQLGLATGYISIANLLQSMKNLYYKKSKSDELQEEFTKIAFFNLVDDSPFLKGFEPPSVLDSNSSYISYGGTKKYLYLGTALSGFNMAFGKASWDLLVYGQKRWFLYPPVRAYFTTEPAWVWWRGMYKNEGGALECIQKSNDLLFVPEVWSKSSLHLRESVGLFQEFIHGATEFSI